MKTPEFYRGPVDENWGYDEIEEEDEFAGADASSFGECVFPGRCCMPSPHFTYECYTVEMAERLAGDEPKPKSVRERLGRDKTHPGRPGDPELLL